MAIAIFGGGILGSCTALELADRGHRVVLFERNTQPLSEASRHNEGKLHLGFVYAADPTFRTAERMIAGAARFADVLGRWMPRSALAAVTTRAFDYVVHRDTMVTPTDIEAHFVRVGRRLDEMAVHEPLAGALDPDRPRWRRLAPDEPALRYNTATVAAAFETCEIAVDTWAIADHLCEALRAHPRVEVRTRSRIIRAEDRAGGGFDVILANEGQEQRTGPFAGIVNATWANRPAIDHRYGMSPRGQWINRQKLGVNLQLSRQPDALPSFTIMLGSFGDVVPYRSGRVYLSWYPVCMIGRSTGIQETDWNAVISEVDHDAVRQATVEALTRICPAVARAAAEADETAIVNGGSIYALGRTDIDDPASQLHERLDAGIESRGAYLSVDTSKFTLGPALAVETADRIARVAAAAA